MRDRVPNITVALLRAAEAGTETPRAWSQVAQRLVLSGLMRITGRTRVYRLSDAGRVELARLVEAGVQPSAPVQPARLAHNGQETTTRDTGARWGRRA